MAAFNYDGGMRYDSNATFCERWEAGLYRDWAQKTDWELNV